MSYANFKETIWSKYIQHEKEKLLAFKADCDYKFEGEAKQGKQVKILGVGRPTIKTYVPGTEIEGAETPDDSSIFLNIDQYDYFNYGVDNIDKAQSKEGLMEALAEETTRGLAEKEDAYIAKVAALGAVEGGISDSTAVTTSTIAKKAIDSAFEYLWNNGVTTKDKVTIYLPPWYYLLLQDKLVELKTQNDSLIAKGVLGLYNSANVKMSNQLHNDGTDDHIIIKTSKAIAACNGIDKLEAYSPEKSFMDAIKGLNTYGAKVIRPKELYVIKAHK
ncbi:MAG: hypothetical protein E7314_05915 [Clostridiales bacterium]|nr:hypothetical protein [Clostridiales bacterium]